MYPAIQRAVGCIDERPLEEPLAQYGIGITLYFKYLKVLIKIFAAYSCIAIPNIYFNWKGSGFTPLRREQMIELNGLTAQLFFTTLGSWGEKTVQCKQEVEGTAFSLRKFVRWCDETKSVQTNLSVINVGSVCAASWTF